MPRIAWLAALVLTACATDDDPGALAAVAGRWEAEAVDPRFTDVLELDDDGNGNALLFRQTSGLFRMDADAVMTPTHGELNFELQVRCNGRSFGCERHDFDAQCMLGGSDRLRCDAPEWYHDPNWIDFDAVD